MKILFLTNISDKLNGFARIADVASQDVSGFGLSYPLSLLRELARYAEVDVYSPPLVGTRRNC